MNMECVENPVTSAVETMPPTAAPSDNGDNCFIDGEGRCRSRNQFGARCGYDINNECVENPVTSTVETMQPTEARRTTGAPTEARRTTGAPSLPPRRTGAPTARRTTAPISTTGAPSLPPRRTGAPTAQSRSTDSTILRT